MDPKTWLGGLLYAVYVKDGCPDAIDRALRDAEAFLKRAQWVSPAPSDNVTEHFKVGEFYPGGGDLGIEEYEDLKVIANDLEAIRAAYGKPVSIVSYDSLAGTAMVSIGGVDFVDFNQTVVALRNAGAIGGQAVGGSQSYGYHV